MKTINDPELLEYMRRETRKIAREMDLKERTEQRSAARSSKKIVREKLRSTPENKSTRKSGK